MNKNQEGMKILLDYLELERKVKILELQLEEAKSQNTSEIKFQEEPYLQINSVM